MDFERVYAEYFSDIYRFALGLCRDPGLAEEITQETFFRALKKIHTHDPEKSLSAWLCQIAKNCYYSYLKKSGRTVEEEFLLEQDNSVDSVEETVLRRDDAMRIKKILHTIPDPYKEVFLWRTFAELSFAQIGQIFSKSENWACVTYHRAKKMIREKMEANK